MKGLEEKTLTPAQNKIQTRREPFFSKEGQGDFFSNRNRSNTSFFSPVTVQTKLSIGQPTDKYEVEADAVADQVVKHLNNSKDTIRNSGTASNEGSVVQTKCSECGEEELPTKEDYKENGKINIRRKPIFESDAEVPEAGLQTKSFGGPPLQRKCAACEEKGKKIQTKPERSIASATPGIEGQLSSELGGGRPLPPKVQKDMGSAFGTDFSRVKIHTDTNAVSMNRSLNAQAFTYGKDIYFNEGKYNTNSNTGQHLLAHELTHVIQQGKNNQVVRKIEGSESGRSGYELEDTIRNLELSIGIAENSLLEDSLDENRKAKIESLHFKLIRVLFQLYDVRGTDGSGVVLDFDPSPQLHEINPGDASKSLSELYYPFSPSQQGSRRPQQTTHSSPPLQAKLSDKISTLSQPAVQRFCDPLICLGIIVLGGLLLSGCSRSSSGSIGPARLRSAKANFDSNNSALTAVEKIKIQTALAGVVGSNDHLLISFYDYYSNKEIVKDSSLTGTGKYATTTPNSDTRVDPTILTAGFSDNTLGGLLIHEYTHTRHHPNFLGSRDYEEGDSYGIEYFFAERNGDTERITEIIAIALDPTPVVGSSRDAVAAFKSYFCKSYGTMKVLYEIIDTGSTSHSSSVLSGLSTNDARSLTGELVSKKEEDHSASLTSVITWVMGHTSVLGIPIGCR